MHSIRFRKKKYIRKQYCLTAIYISLNSFEHATFFKIHGTREMPDLVTLTKEAKMPIKLSCILTPHNKHETVDYIRQARELGIKRIAFRHIFNDPERWPLFPPSLSPSTPPPSPTRYHVGNPVYDLDGVEVTHWIFEKVEGNSLNLFSDGTLSEEYLLVNNPKTLQQKNEVMLETKYSEQRVSL